MNLVKNIDRPKMKFSVKNSNTTDKTLDILSNLVIDMLIEKKLNKNKVLIQN